MSFIEILLIAFSLSADASGVSTCKGIAVNKIKITDALKIGLYFGIFQMLMPILGYYLGRSILKEIFKYSNYITFILLFIIGIRMISDAKNNKTINDIINTKELLVLAIATSLDAFAIGIAFSINNIRVLLPSTIIGIITFILSFTCFIIGNKIGLKWQTKSLIISGIILILLSLKSLFNI